MRLDRRLGPHKRLKAWHDGYYPATAANCTARAGFKRFPFSGTAFSIHLHDFAYFLELFLVREVDGNYVYRRLSKTLSSFIITILEPTLLNSWWDFMLERHEMIYVQISNGSHISPFLV